MFSVVNDGFASPNKSLWSKTMSANCGGVRRGSERSDQPSRTEPEPPLGGEAFTILLSDIGLKLLMKNSE
jgi:hypothetical protein